ncbi:MULTISPECIES: M23 family metallopeptidase [Butyricimonas]|uniref:M23 family metallopeptidase n=1 Tax=Butyricimonas TaxID=574697 RepID=UPI0003817A00|nr:MULTISPECIES: M23 family metallopeptidase [Butyricimonas]
MKSKKRKYWNKLKNRYKLTIFNESTYEEVMHLRLSPLQVLTALSSLAVILIILTIMLIAFTNLKEFIPGYPSQQLRRQLTQNALRVDSLLNEVQKKDRFLHSIQMILRDEELDTTRYVVSAEDIKANYDTTMLGVSPEEAGFRETMEREERYNLSLGQVSSSDDDFYHFFSPLSGIVTNHFDEGTRHYGVDLVAKQNSNVLSVLDGVVIFTDWTIKTGYVIQVQHNGNLVSMYKHNSVLLKKQGDFVRAGEAIAVVGNTGEETTGPHLHFELWQAGKPLNPETFIKFK